MPRAHPPPPRVTQVISSKAKLLLFSQSCHALLAQARPTMQRILLVVAYTHDHASYHCTPFFPANFRGDLQVKIPTPVKMSSLTVRILHSPADVTHRGSLGEHEQKHVEHSRVHLNPCPYSLQQVRGPRARLMHHVSGGVAYWFRDDIFSIQLPRQDLGVLYDREQISRVLTERLVGRIGVLSATSSHG